MMKKGEERLLKEDKELEAEHLRETEQADEIQKQLNVMLKSKLENDNKDREQVGQAFESWQDQSTKGISDSLLKMKMNSSSQLTDNISKFEFGLEVKKRKILEIKSKRAVIQRDLKELRLNENAETAGKAITDFLEKYKIFEDYFMNEFLSTIHQANSIDAKWPTRLARMGDVPRAYEVIGISHLKPALLGSLTIETLVEKVQNLTSYGPALLPKNRNVKEHVPVSIQRETFFGYTKP